MHSKHILTHTILDETENNIQTVFSLSKTFASQNERLSHKYVIDSNEEYNDSLELHTSPMHRIKKFDFNNGGLESLNNMELDSLENNKCNKNGPTHELEAKTNIKHDRTVETTEFDENNAVNDSLHQTNTNRITSNIIENEQKCIDLPGNYLTTYMCELHLNHFY